MPQLSNNSWFLCFFFSLFIYLYFFVIFHYFFILNSFNLVCFYYNYSLSFLFF